MTAAPPYARIAYLGPRGTFSEAALRGMPQAQGAEQIPESTVAAALAAVRHSRADAALVPIENSVEGSVSATLDELGEGDPLLIVDEVALPVRFSLITRPGTRMRDITRVASQPYGPSWAGTTKRSS